MMRSLMFFLLVAGVVLAGAQFAFAAGEWPTVSFPSNPTSPLDKHYFKRGDGFYLDPIKIGMLLCLFWIWVKTADWVSQDCQILGMPYALWNPIVFFPFFATFLLVAITLPFFIAGYFLLLVAYAAPFGIYVWKRNQRVPPHRMIFTGDHFRQILATTLNRFGAKMDVEKKAAHEKGPPVTLTAMGAADEGANQANLVEARQTIGFTHAKEILSDAMLKRAERVILEYTAERVTVKYHIDGLWHDLPDRDRETADLLLAVFKKLANLNVEDRRSKQDGKFGVEFKGTKLVAALGTQGTPTGERVTIQLAVKAVKFDSLEALGMRPRMAKAIKEKLASSKGLVLFSSLPGGGLTTTTNLALRNLDRFMRDVVAIEDVAHREPDVENVETTTYNGAAGESPATVLKKMLLKQPNVVVVRDLVNAESTKMLLDYIETEEKLVIASIRAKEALEAILRVFALKVPAAEVAQAVLAVLNQRLIRKLCPKCKVAYEPTNDLVKKLGIPSGRVDVFYREPQPSDYEKPPTEPCDECGGIGYVGRASLFEWLVIDDKLRAALAKEPKLETLRPIARAAGNPTLQDEGLVLVAQGTTSLAELQRVLKL